jgi:hypothetical protein
MARYRGNGTGSAPRLLIDGERLAIGGRLPGECDERISDSVAPEHTRGACRMDRAAQRDTE